MPGNGFCCEDLPSLRFEKHSPIPAPLDRVRGVNGHTSSLISASTPYFIIRAIVQQIRPKYGYFAHAHRQTAAGYRRPGGLPGRMSRIVDTIPSMSHEELARLGPKVPAPCESRDSRVFRLFFSFSNDIRYAGAGASHGREMQIGKWVMTSKKDDDCTLALRCYHAT